MKQDIEELKRLFYSDRLTQYGKRKLIEYYEQRIKELEEKWNKDTHKLQNALDMANADKINNYIPVSLVEEKIEELEEEICSDDEYLGNRQCIELELLEKVQKKLLERRK